MALVLDGLLGFRLPADGSLKLYEASGNGENFIALKAPSNVAADATFVLPGTDGTSGQYLKTDGSGNLEFASLPSFPSGAVVGTTDTQTLIGKTINLASNTLVTTLAQLNAAVSDADVASLTGFETLENKTLIGLKETKITMADNNINLSAGNYFSKTISTSTTLTVSNVPSSGTTGSFILDLTNGGSSTVTWWSNVKWAGGNAPSLTASGRDVLGFFTHDNGTTWTGLVLGKDIK